MMRPSGCIQFEPRQTRQESTKIKRSVVFRILSLAGVRLRGAFAIGLLEELERRTARPLWEYFDLIAGTSTGSITAAALCCGVTMREIREFYESHSARIFHPRAPYSPKNPLRAIYPLIRKILQRRGQNPDNFFRSRYCPHSLTGAMEEGFGEVTLRDAKLCRLIVPTVNLTEGVTAVLRTPHLPIEYDSFVWRLVDVIVASSAAPTYFPHKRMRDGNDYVDGGLWAIDPGVVALAEAVKITDQCCRKVDAPFDLQDVSMLSIGTGQATYSLAPPEGDAGMLFWS
jgi:patatin-like phospholipase/acyl hydrolase